MILWSPPTRLTCAAATRLHCGQDVGIELRALPTASGTNLVGGEAKRAAEIGTLDMGAVHRRIAKDRARKRRAAQVGIAKVGAEQNRSLELSAAEFCSGEFGSGKIGLLEVG